MASDLGDDLEDDLERGLIEAERERKADEEVRRGTNHADFLLRLGTMCGEEGIDPWVARDMTRCLRCREPSVRRRAVK